MKTTRIILLLTLILSSCINSTEEGVDYNEFAYLEIDIVELQEGYASKKYTVKEVVQAYLDRIEQIDVNGPGLNSVIVTNPDALEIAAALDASNESSRGPLFGIPVLLKDNIDTSDKMPTTAGSRALKDSYPLQDSYLAKKLRESGAVILGKANLSEWANFRGNHSSSGWSGLVGQTKNPYVLTRNPCGSSSGSGVSVSANLTVLAIGTETNGSIVCPSNNNGIVGIKPTVGLVSRSGVIPISFTQDTPGPMARTVRDATIALGAMVGVDTLDTKTLESEGHFLSDYTPYLNKDGLQGKRIGWYKTSYGDFDAIDQLTDKIIERIKAAGAEVIEIESIAPRGTGSHSFQVMLHEYKDGLNDYFASLGEKAPIKNLEELIAFNEKDSIELKYFNQAYLKMAQETDGMNSKTYEEHLSALIEGSQKQGIDRVMDELDLDAIIAPTGGPAWNTDWLNGDNYHIGSSSSAAWAGYPNITVPMGSIHGLPLGMSFFGRAWSEPQLIEIAYAFEQLTQARFAPSFRANDSE
jgi:amidase